MQVDDWLTSTDPLIEDANLDVISLSLHCSVTGMRLPPSKHLKNMYELTDFLNFQLQHQ